jgi:hypothetical protein
VSGTTTPPSPDYNSTGLGITPSVFIPWGWHGDGPLVCICYNSYVRTVAFRRAGREREMEPSPDASVRVLGPKWGMTDDCLGYTIRDDFSTGGGGADEWFALRGLGTLPQPVTGPLGAAAVRGGVQFAEWDADRTRLSLSPMSRQYAQPLVAYTLVVTRAEDFLGYDSLNWDCDGKLSGADKRVMKAMAVDLAYALQGGDLKTVGGVGDRYWARAADRLGFPGQADHDYRLARVAGALAGAPMDSGADTLFLLAPPETHDNILAIMGGNWRRLPFQITPWGARLCGAF